MRPVEDRALGDVAGAATRQDRFGFVERVPLGLQRIRDRPAVQAGS